MAPATHRLEIEDHEAFDIRDSFDQFAIEYEISAEPNLAASPLTGIEPREHFTSALITGD